MLVNDSISKLTNDGGTTTHTPFTSTKTLDAKISDWKNERRNLLEKQNTFVFQSSISLGLTGLAFAIPGAISGGTVGLVFLNIGVFIGVVGLSIFATINPSKVNFNEIYEKKSNRLAMVILMLTATASYIGFFVPGAFVTLAFMIFFWFKIKLPTDSSTALSGNNRIIWFSFINKLIYYTLVDDLMFAIGFLYNGIESSSNGSFNLRYGESIGLNMQVLQNNNAGPRTPSFASMYFAMASFCILDFAVICAFFIFQIYLKKVEIQKTEANKKKDSTTRSSAANEYNIAMKPKEDVTAQQIYTVGFMMKNPLPESALLWLYFYIFMNKLAITGIIKWSYLLYFYKDNSFTVPVDDEIESSFDSFVAISYLVAFILILLPPVFLVMIGPDNLFQMTCKYWNLYFERAEFENIGGWMAQLLESVDVEDGKIWYLTRDEVIKWKTSNSTDKLTDHLVASLQNDEEEWIPGTVENVNEKSFSVKIKKYDLTICVQRKKVTSFSKLQTDVKPRFVRWEEIREDKDVFYKPSHDLVDKSDSCKEIDFFISHAWRDHKEDESKVPAERQYFKFKKLEDLAEDFKKQNGTYPTFWLDRCCLDEKNLEDSLKMLPVNIMKCKKMVILYGENYLKRIWCIWELLTICALSDSSMFDRLIILPVDEYCDFANDVRSFDVLNAEAWDRNDEVRMKELIQALGNDEFNNKVRSLGPKLRQKDSFVTLNAKLNVLRNAVDSNTKRLQTIEEKLDIILGVVKSTSSQGFYNEKYVRPYITGPLSSTSVNIAALEEKSEEYESKNTGSYDIDRLIRRA